MIAVPERVRTAVQWEQAEEDNWEAGLRIIVNHFKELKQVSYHILDSNTLCHWVTNICSGNFIGGVAW
jgi:hypothetical protein